MLITHISASVTEADVPQVVEGSPQAVAGYLTQGGEVGPVTFRQGETPRFQATDWLFVTLRQPESALAAYLEHPITEHAGLICLSGQAGDKIDCLIGFPLPATVTDALRYRQLLSGLGTIYGAVVPDSETQGWRAGADPKVTVLNGRLTETLVEQLALLGQENRSHRTKKGGYMRSSFRLDRNIVVKRTDGEEALLASLVEGTGVFCPIHVDTHGTATVIGKGRAKAVQCAFCMRNYWNVSRKRDADFGHFRRVFDTLRAQEDAARVSLDKRQFVLQREKYLPAMDQQPGSLDLRTGFTLVRSPKGSGKTKALEHLLNECRLKKKSVLLIGHRRSLLGSLARRLGLDLYFETYDGEDGQTEYRAVQASQRYAISLDSMPGRLKPNRHKFDVVLVDESEQVIRHLTGETLKRSRRTAFLLFKHYLGAASSVYLLDADLDMLSLSMMFEAANPLAPVRFLVNEPPVTRQEYDLITTREGLMARLGEAVEAGRKCYVATNSKGAAERIGLWIGRRWPSRRVEVVTRDNGQAPRIQSILSNIVAEYQTGVDGQAPLDVLVGSPSIGTGIDITFPDNAVVVDHVFGLFEAGINTHHDVDQQLARVRHPGRVSVWINHNVQHYETDPAALRHELKNTVLRTDLLVGYTRDGMPIYSDQDKPLVDLWSEIVSHERTSKNTLFFQWSALREAAGWVSVADSVDEDDKARGKRAMIEGKALSEQAQVERLVSARDLDAAEAERLTELDRLGAPLSDEDRAALDKYRLGLFYATTVDADLVIFDDNGRTRRQVEWLEIMVSDKEVNQDIDRAEIDRRDDERVIVFDRQFRSAKAEMLASLLAAADLLDARSGEFSLTARVSTQTLDSFVRCFKVNSKRIETELKLDMRRDIDRKPVQQLGEVLALIGLSFQKAEATKKDGIKTRAYGLETAHLEALLEVTIRREQQREERRQLKQAESDDAGADEDVGDNPASMVNSHPEKALSPDVESTAATAVVEMARATIKPPILNAHHANLLAAFNV